MFCTRKITDDLWWVGGNDRRLSLFEGVYSVPKGVSYNSYLLLDESTVLFDTVDAKVAPVFFENLKHLLGGRPLDFVVIQHMEPDHSATLGLLLEKHPETTVVCNAKSAQLIDQFFKTDISSRAYIVDEKSVFNSGVHEFQFFNAPMVHWPEVMFTYDKTDGVLFSADAFGVFGALNGALFADEVDFWRDYLDEARRYYGNIVGKYGMQVATALKKLAGLPLNYVCPLHGFVWRKGFNKYLEKYLKWSTYTPEENGVMIAYASIYGNTENAAEILASRLREKGVKTEMFDVSVDPASEIVAASFKWSHLVFASSTYNGGIFISMEELLRDLVAHSLQNRTVAFMENGSWAATSGKQMRGILEGCKNLTVLENTVSIRSTLGEAQEHDLDALCEEIAQSLNNSVANAASSDSVDSKAFEKIACGLFVLTANDSKQNGCIINTAMQVSNAPFKVSIAVNRQNLTHDMIEKTGIFNLSVLTESTDFELFKHFGFRSGRTVDKFDRFTDYAVSENGVAYITKANAYFSCKVLETVDCGSHTLFVAEVTEAKVLNTESSATYSYYHSDIKPRPQDAEKKNGYRCKVCGYVYEGDTLPDDFICPLCKHGAEDFEPIV